MSILFRYIARQYLRLSLLTLGSLVLIYLASELFGKAGKFSRHAPDAAALIAYFALRLPRAAYEMLPMAGLIASVLTVSLLSRHHEVTALRTCGVGLSKIVAPIAAVAFMLSASSFAANWSMIPTATAKAQAVKDVRIEGKPLPSTLQRNRIWLRLGRRTFLNVRMADPSNRSLYGVRIYEVGDGFQLKRSIDAPRVSFEDGTWAAYNGVERMFPATAPVRVETFERRVIDLEKMPQDFTQIEIKEEHIEYPQLRSYVANLKRAGIQPGRYAVDQASRLSVPFITVVMALIGIPFGLTETRRGGWGVAVGISLLVALAYWTVYSLAISLGRGGVLPPLVSAWIANLIFLAVASALLIQKRH